MTLRASLIGHRSSIQDIALSPCERFIASCSEKVEEELNPLVASNIDFGIKADVVNWLKFNDPIWIWSLTTNQPLYYILFHNSRIDFVSVEFPGTENPITVLASGNEGSTAIKIILFDAEELTQGVSVRETRRIERPHYEAAQIVRNEEINQFEADQEVETKRFEPNLYLHRGFYDTVDGKTELPSYAASKVIQREEHLKTVNTLFSEFEYEVGDTITELLAIPREAFKWSWAVRYNDNGKRFFIMIGTKNTEIKLFNIRINSLEEVTVQCIFIITGGKEMRKSQTQSSNAVCNIVMSPCLGEDNKNRRNR